MTRAEAKKEIDTGWVLGNLVGMFLGFDLDPVRLQQLVMGGAVAAWTRLSSCPHKTLWQ
jgi:hypothetical protein